MFGLLVFWILDQLVFLGSGSWFFGFGSMRFSGIRILVFLWNWNGFSKDLDLSGSTGLTTSCLPF